jgi:hypothetical protein
MYQRDGKTEANFDKCVYADVYPSVCGLVSAPKPLEKLFLNFVVLRETLLNVVRKFQFMAILKHKIHEIHFKKNINGFFLCR